MKAFLQHSVEFLRSEDGPTATEYAVFVGVIAMTALIAMGMFGERVDAIYVTIDTAIAGGS